MNTLKLLGLTCALLAATAVRAADETPGITVTGTAVTEAKPDMLKWNVTVSNRGPELAAVSDTHAAYTAEVLRTLRDAGTRPEDMQTSGMRFSENREYRGNSWIREGYIASTEVAFTLKDPAAYKQLWITLARLNGVSVDWGTWDVSNRIALQNSTRLEALKAAKTKAGQMAAGLGVALGEPTAIAEEQLYESRFGPQNMRNVVQSVAADSQQPDDTVAPGTVPIRIRVRVTFRIGR